MSDDKYSAIGKRTTHLIEECSELAKELLWLIKILCKCERFGWDTYHPKDKDKISNLDLVLQEMGDVEVRIHEVKLELWEMEKNK